VERQKVFCLYLQFFDTHYTTYLHFVCDVDNTYKAINNRNAGDFPGLVENRPGGKTLSPVSYRFETFGDGGESRARAHTGPSHGRRRRAAREPNAKIDR